MSPTDRQISARKKNMKDALNHKTDKNQPKKFVSKTERVDDQMRMWIAYWRCNLHRFAEDLGVRLHLFQKLILFMIHYFPNFMYIASRGTGKSFLIALYSILMCILYPNIKVVISSATRGQAILMIKQYVRYFYNEYPLIRNEIEEIKDGTQEPICIFKNGSYIKAVTASDRARGERANILILEEFAIMKKAIIDSVLKKFGTVPRQRAFAYKEEYANYPTEPNREIYISSARYKAEWGWDEVKKFFKGMMQKRTPEEFWYGIMSSDWHLPTKYGLTDEKKLREEITLEGGDDITWSMEMDSLFFGENQNSFFKYKDFMDNRVIEKAEYPHDNDLFMGKKKVPERRKKKNGEICVLSIDVAVTPKKDSDNTIIDFVVGNEYSEGYRRTLKYSESMNGEKINEQALRIKQLWYDFNIDYIVLDIMNVGSTLYSALTSETYDPERDYTYPALIAFNDEDYKKHAYDPNGIQCVFVVKATADINNEIARALSANLNLGKMRFLITESEFRDMAIKQNESYLNIPQEERIKIELPYIQTTLMINETINLEYTITNGRIRVQEVGKMRKDRYTSLAYANWFINSLESDLLRKQDDGDDWEVFSM